jgi:hypothetical protein
MGILNWEKFKQYNKDHISNQTWGTQILYINSDITRITYQTKHGEPKSYILIQQVCLSVTGEGGGGVNMGREVNYI